MMSCLYVTILLCPSFYSFLNLVLLNIVCNEYVSNDCDVYIIAPV